MRNGCCQNKCKRAQVMHACSSCSKRCGKSSGIWGTVDGFPVEKAVEYGVQWMAFQCNTCENCGTKSTSRDTTPPTQESRNTRGTGEASHHLVTGCSKGCGLASRTPSKKHFRPASVENSESILKAAKTRVLTQKQCPHVGCPTSRLVW